MYDELGKEDGQTVGQRVAVELLLHIRAFECLHRVATDPFLDVYYRVIIGSARILWYRHWPVRDHPAATWRLVHFRIKVK